MKAKSPLGFKSIQSNLLSFALNLTSLLLIVDIRWCQMSLYLGDNYMLTNYNQNTWCHLSSLFFSIPVFITFQLYWWMIHTWWFFFFFFFLLFHYHRGVQIAVPFFHDSLLQSSLCWTPSCHSTKTDGWPWKPIDATRGRKTNKLVLTWWAEVLWWRWKVEKELLRRITCHEESGYSQRADLKLAQSALHPTEHMFSKTQMWMVSKFVNN